MMNQEVGRTHGTVDGGVRPSPYADTDADPIDRIIRRLEAAIQRSKQGPSRIGYFAALYLRVTVTIRNQIGTGFFEDDQRMEIMDRNFATRYLTALEQYETGNPSLLPSWAVAFQATLRDDLLIVQHLLVAMNAHINIDLAAAAAETCPGRSIESFRSDFDKINDVLASIVPTVIKEIDDLSPLLHLLAGIAETEEEAIIDFSMDAARAFAWDLAVRLAFMSPSEQQALIAERAQSIADLGEDIVSPGLPWQALLDVIRAPESKDVLQNIDTLDTGNPLPLRRLGAAAQPAASASATELPNQVYYFEIAQGQWIGQFTLDVTNWKKLLASDIGLINKLLIAAMVAFQKLFGAGTISSTITAYPNQGKAGVAKNDIHISKSWLRLFTSHEVYTLSPNGHGVNVDARVHFGPIPFLFREHDVYPAVVFDGGMRNLYFLKLLKTRFLGNYRVQPDRNHVQATLENDWAKADETLNRVESS